jgi:hypothetical protein
MARLGRSSHSFNSILGSVRRVAADVLVGVCEVRDALSNRKEWTRSTVAT